MRNKTETAGRKKKMRVILATCLSLCLCLTAFFPGLSASAAAREELIPEMDKVEALAKSAELNQAVTAEGFTLLKNDSIDGGAKALPIPLTSLNPNNRSVKTGISVFGKQSADANFVYGGSVSAGSAGNGRVDLHTSLASAGYDVNASLKTFYETNTRSGSGGTSQSEVRETSGETIAADTEGIVWSTGSGNSLISHKNVALIVITRTGRENGDMALRYEDRRLPDNSANGAAGTGVYKHLLELSENEKSLLRYVKAQNFTRTIVVFNSISFEYDFLFDEEYGIDGAIWIGAPGRTGLVSLGKILSGSINPSGKTVDIAYTDFTADPTYFSFSNNTHLTDADGVAMDNKFYKDVSGTLEVWNVSADGSRQGYSSINEGIYVGYRYYETIAADIAAGRYVYMNGNGEDGKLHKVDGTFTAKSDKSANANAWYDDSVVFPFGYGMSYTDFQWELVSQTPAAGTALTADGKIEIKVKVTNTGTVAGKDVVELYYNAPYTAGGVEKAHVVLGDYDKTSLLQPGYSETVTLTLKVRSMASFDYNDANSNSFKGYELDAGTYNIYVGKNSNDAWRNTAGIKTAYNVGAGGLKITHSEYTGYEMVPQLTHSAGPADNKILQKMSREDFVGTFPKTLTRAQRVITQAYRDTLGYTAQAANKHNKADNYAAGKPWEYTTLPTQAASPAVGNEAGLIRLYQLMNVPKNDPMWQTFLNQFTIDQLRRFTTPAGRFETPAYPALGVPRIIECDGPYGWVGAGSNEVPAAYTSNHLGYYASSAVTAATWNDELVEKMGRTKGEEGLVHGFNAIYAPGVNYHRSLFEGRNNEYYSEDGLLGGRMAAAEARGLRSRGCIAVIKHFAAREEENETQLVRYFTEQTAREIILKQFQIAVEEGGALGMMSSNNAFGETWVCGADYGLATEILRNEWGFEGYMVTDWAWGEFSRADGMASMTIAGNDKIMAANVNWVYDATDPTLVNAIRKAAHNVMFAVSRTNAMPQYKGDHEIYASGERFSTDVSSYSTGYEDTTYSSHNYRYVRAYNVIGELPAGFKLDVQKGTISGNANNAAPGKYEIVVEALINNNVYRRDNVNIYISGVGYAGGALAAGNVGANYVGSVATAESIFAGGVAYRLVSGSLPAGLVLDSNGTIIGTPTAAGTATFKVAASAIGVPEAEATFTITVGAAIVTPDYADEIDDLEDKNKDLEDKAKGLEDKIKGLEDKIKELEGKGSGCNSSSAAIASVFGLLACAVVVFAKKRAKTV